MGRKYFMLHNDSLEVLSELTDEQAGKLFKAIAKLKDDPDYKLDGLLNAVFIPFKNQNKRDGDKYETICKRNKENGQKGGRPKETQTNPENPTAYFGNPENHKSNSNKKSNTNKKKNNKQNKIEVNRKEAKEIKDVCLDENILERNKDYNELFNNYSKKLASKVKGF